MLWNNIARQAVAIAGYRLANFIINIYSYP